MKILKYIFLTILSLCLGIGAKAGLPERPVPERLVNDLAGILSHTETDRLERILTAFDDSTSNQITVIITKDLEGYTPVEYATQIGIKWGVGSKEHNNGIVMLVKPKTLMSNGEAFIAVGYGLEGAIPDTYAKFIVDDEMIPHFKSNDYFGGIEQGCRTLMQLASGEISEPRNYDDEVDIIVVFIFFVFIICIVLLIAVIGNGGNGGNHRGNGTTVFHGPIITYGNTFGGNRGSFGGGFGGGFGGFGGFGGGSFGGGGAGGSW